MHTVSSWLKNATVKLVDTSISSAKLDAEIILAHTLHKSRTYLHAHDDEPLSAHIIEIADTRLALRLDHTPIAYIVGHKEFYGRLFRVTPATLIPRPESETIITLLKELSAQTSLPLNATPKRLVDIGTGSGCLGISAKLELPELDVTLLDISRHALTVAESNASSLHADVSIKRSDLLAAYPFSADYVVANLPYVDPSWERSLDTNHEPDLALFASRGGLALILRLLDQAPSQMPSGGIMLLEADPRQHTEISRYAKDAGFSVREIRDFIVCLQKN